MAASSLIEKVEHVIWDDHSDAFRSVRALVLEEMKYRIYPGVVWDLQKWAQSKTEEHREAYRRIDKILQAVKENVQDDQDHCPSLQKLKRHHERIAKRYDDAVFACKD